MPPAKNSQVRSSRPRPAVTAPSTVPIRIMSPSGYARLVATAAVSPPVDAWTAPKTTAALIAPAVSAAMIPSSQSRESSWGLRSRISSSEPT